MKQIQLSLKPLCCELYLPSCKLISFFESYNVNKRQNMIIQKVSGFKNQ